MKKVLPIAKKCLVKSECWTQILFAIIQTSPYASAWIASHMKLFSDYKKTPSYGTILKQFDFRETVDILKHEEIDIFTVKPDNIISRIIEEINNNNYMIVELKYDILPKYKLHETLIYGYDTDKKVIYTTIINNNTQNVEEYLMPYNELLLTYSSLFNHLIDDKTIDDFSFISVRNYPITRIHIRDDYYPFGGEFDFIKNITDEKNGKEFILQDDGSNNSSEVKKYYTGIKCLIAAKEKANDIIHDREFIERDTDIIYNDLFDRIAETYSKELYKLFEFRYINLNSIKWFCEVVNGFINEDDKKVIQLYNDCVMNMKKIYQISLKFRIKRDWSLVENISIRLQKQYSEEYAVLDKMIPILRESWYKYKRKSL